MHGSRREAVKGLTGGIEFLFKKNKIEWLKGLATFESADTRQVGDRTSAPRTSSSQPARRSRRCPVTVDQQRISTTPPRAGAFRSAGATLVAIRRRRNRARARLRSGGASAPRVPVVSFLDQNPACDGCREPQGVEQNLQKAGFELRLGTKVIWREVKDGGVVPHRRAGQTGQAETIERSRRCRSAPSAEHRGARARKAGLNVNNRGQGLEIDTTYARRCPASGRSAT
jgi:dihydrolipoamide dehydrogenase